MDSLFEREDNSSRDNEHGTDETLEIVMPSSTESLVGSGFHGTSDGAKCADEKN